MEKSLKPGLTIATFLKLTKLIASTLGKASAIPAQIILGNESADLDSTFGPIMLGYLKGLTMNAWMREAGENEKDVSALIKEHAKTTMFHIPVINLRRRNMASRFENKLFFEDYMIVVEDLVTLDDIDFMELRDN